jgi:hypothetical protein
MLLRSWRCLNRKCGKTFNSYEHANPDCTFCGCARVAWVPGGGHIGKVAAPADATLRSLATNYGMANLNSPSESRLNRAMPKFPVHQPDMPVKHFAPGFSAPVSSAGATCQVSEASVDLRGKVATGRALTHSRSIPGPQSNTEMHGRHIGAVR